MAENLAFTERTIRKLQRRSILNGLEEEAMAHYLFRQGRMHFDMERNLFWVDVPNGPPQIAVWMMPITV